MNETTKRILSGVTIAGIVVGALRYDTYNWIFPFLLISIFAILGLFEFYVLVDRGIDGSAFRKLGYVFAFLILASFYAQFLFIKAPDGAGLSSFHQTLMKYFYPSGLQLTPLLLISLLILASVIQIIYRPLDGGIYSLSVTVFGVFYTTVGVSHALLLYALPVGLFYLILFTLLPIASDTGAYFSGRWFGRHNAGLKVSPKKTYEGYLGGIITAIIIANLYIWLWNENAGTTNHVIPMGTVEISLLAFLMAIISIFGDLVESAFKRDAKIKDSANTIPGHGGVLDLADAMFYCFPAGYFYIVIRQAMGYSL